MLGERLRRASVRAVSKFANKGFLLAPPIDQTYDPSTGNVGSTRVKHPLEYVTVTNKTNGDTELKARSFRESVVWFSTSIQLEVNETWDIEGIDGSIYDILAVEKVIVNDIVVGYYALMKGRE